MASSYVKEVNENKLEHFLVAVLTRNLQEPFSLVKVFNKVIAVLAAANHCVANYLSGRWTLTLKS